MSERTAAQMVAMMATVMERMRISFFASRVLSSRTLASAFSWNFVSFALFRSLKLVDPKTAAEQAAYGKWLDETSDREEARHADEDPEMIAQTELALDAVFRRVAENGWGPYPRKREEILQIRKPPGPAYVALG